jgi:hypothetical protein
MFERKVPARKFEKYDIDVFAEDEVHGIHQVDSVGIARGYEEFEKRGSVVA